MIHPFHPGRLSALLSVKDHTQQKQVFSMASTLESTARTIEERSGEERPCEERRGEEKRRTGEERMR